MKDTKKDGKKIDEITDAVVNDADAVVDAVVL